MKSFVVIFLIASPSLTVTQQAVHNHSRSENQHGSHHRHDATGEEHDTALDHEAILGSREDAEEFDELPPEEAKTRLKELLSKMDIDLNKKIDKKELHAWIKGSLKAIDEKDAIDLFKEADKDTNGLVSWEEYKTSQYGAPQENDQEEERYLQEDEYVFKAADKNGDGTLTQKEFNSFMHPAEDLEIHPHVLKQVLDQKDSNKDGTLSFQEFIGDRLTDHNKEWLDDEMDRFENELDKNKDGSLSSEEIVAWIIPIGREQVATEEVDFLFSEADGDKDGVLSFEDVLNKTDVFVGSAATGYENLKNMHRFEEEL